MPDALECGVAASLGHGSLTCQIGAPQYAADMTGIEEMEKTVLALPMKQRVLLAESLLDSLAPAEKVWLEAEELAEVERRERQIESGEVQPLQDDEFWRRVDAGGER
jgi:putative addiction module component (TIGR02574 family)